MIPTLRACDWEVRMRGYLQLTELPDTLAMSVRLWNTDGTVNGLGLNIVGWTLREF